MNWEAWVTLATILVVLYGLARNVAGPDVILLGGAVFLMTLGQFTDRLPSTVQFASAFGNEGLLTVAVMFVVAAGLTETGAVRLVTDRVLGRPDTVRSAQVRLMLPVTGMSAFLNNTPIVAMFMPVVRDWCKRTGISPSKLFIPLSYAAILGGTCSLIGTSTNLIVQGLLVQARRTDPSVPVMGMFTLTWVGLPIAIAGLLYVIIASRRLLPERVTFRAQVSDPRQYTVEMLVQPGSPIDGQTIEQAGLRHLPGMYLAHLERNGAPIVPVGPDEVLLGNDRVIFVGVVESVVDLKRVRGLQPATNQTSKLSASQHDRCLIEAVISDTNPLNDRSIREGRFRSRYDAAVLAVHRNGERIAGKIGDIVLRPGDTLLLESHPRFVRSYRDSRDFLLVSPVDDSQPPRHGRARIALAILAAMVLAITFEEYTGIGTLNGALLAAGLMGLTGCCSAGQARRSLDLPVLIAIGAALGIGRAMETSGLADIIAVQVLRLSRGLGPTAVLAATYGLTLLCTELVTNNAAAVLMFPVARAAAAALDVNLMPFAVVVAVAASAGFATPLGYQTHMMVYGPGGYRFMDYVRFGVPLDLVVMVITVALAPVFFPFH